MKTVCSSKQICYFLTGGSIIMHYELAFCPENNHFNLKYLNDYLVSHKHTIFHSTRHSLMYWSLVDYCDVFINCLDSNSDGIHSQSKYLLVSKWCNDIFLLICSYEETVSFWLAWGWVTSTFSFLGELYLCFQKTRKVDIHHHSRVWCFGVLK